MGIKISEMTPDASVSGVELLPVSDAGVAKSVTIATVKSFVVDQIEAIAAGTAVTEADSVFILQDGALKPVDIDKIAQHAIDTVWGKAVDASPADADVLTMKSGATEQTVTLAVLATYVQGAIRAAVLNPATLDAAAATSGADLLVIGQSGVAKKLTLTELNTAVLAGLNAYVTALTAVTVSADSDVLYVIQGGVQKKVTLAEIKTLFGVSSAVQGPAATTENYVPQWDGTTKLLKDGLPVATAVAAAGGTGTGLVNETGIRTAIDAVSKPSTFTEKEAPVDGDSVLISDSEDSGISKSTLLSSIKTLFLAAVEFVFPTATKASIVDADKMVIQDSGDSASSKSVLWSTVKSVLKTYFDSIYSTLALGETDATAYRGDRGKTAYDHSQVTHAPADAQKNSDILQAEIEAKLTGEIATHTHADTGLALGETDATAYRGDRGKTAYDHSQVTHAPVNKVSGINSQTGTAYTLVLSDAGKLVQCANLSAFTLNVPANATVAFEVGAVISVEQGGVGIVTATPAGGVTINSIDDGYKTPGLFGVVQFVKVATDTWTMIGGVV